MSQQERLLSDFNIDTESLKQGIEEELGVQIPEKSRNFADFHRSWSAWAETDHEGKEFVCLECREFRGTKDELRTHVASESSHKSWPEYQSSHFAGDKE